jgi:putative transposase
MGGESEAAWRALLDDLVKRGLKTPELVIADGAPGLEKALAALWPDVLVQRCTVHKHRNLLAMLLIGCTRNSPPITEIWFYAATKQEVEAKRKAFIRKWQLKCPAAAASLEEAGDKLFTFTRFPKSQWKSIRTSNAIERLHEEFKRRIKTQTLLPSAETAAMLFWALLASGQITMPKVDGWESLNEKASDYIIDLAAWCGNFAKPEIAKRFFNTSRDSTLTPADVDFGRGQTVLIERERIKRQTIANRRLLHRQRAAWHHKPDEPETLLF